MIIKLSNGVEISEETVVGALKKQGISVEPPKPKHIFEAGDIAYYEGLINEKCNWRLIVRIHGKLYPISFSGTLSTFDSKKQEYFEANNYKFVGKLKDLIK